MTSEFQNDAEGICLPDHHKAA